MDGSPAEDRALQFLQEQGLKLLARNWRCKLGELDLVMQDGDTESTRRMASSPSCARRASNPSSLSAVTMTSPSAGSSSTTRMSGRFPERRAAIRGSPW